jgi:hypothetical protein
MCAEASAVLRAVTADFFFNCWYLEIPSDNRIRHIPRRVHYRAQGFRSIRHGVEFTTQQSTSLSCCTFLRSIEDSG